MHFLTMVIGDDPDLQLERCRVHYDWYQFGGRWSGHLILKPGRRGRLGVLSVLTRLARPGRADQAAKGDIDFMAVAAETLADLMAGWDTLEKRGMASDPHERRNLDIPESCRTREQFEAYARRRSAHGAPSALVHRSRWHGPWWLSDEPIERAAEKWDAWLSTVLASLPDDTLLTVVDCHV